MWLQGNKEGKFIDTYKIKTWRCQVIIVSAQSKELGFWFF